jgi:phage shock protein A
MGIFRRVNDIISANLNDLIDKFEEPERMLKQAIREMEQSIDETTAAAAKAIASERLLNKELAAHRQQAAQWQQRAEHAVAARDDDLARQWLRRKHEHDKLIGALSEQVLAADQTGQSLRRQVEAMRAKHAEAKRKLATLAARSKAAHARKRLQTVGAGFALRSDAFSRFDRLRERVEQAEAEADALGELRAGGNEPVAAKFQACDVDLCVEADLQEIKQRLVGPTP